MNNIELKKFLEEGNKIEHSVKSSLGRINKSIQRIEDFVEDFKLKYE